MLTAKLKNGNRLNLGYPYKKETLLSLRKREEFFCPVCGEKVILKLGDSKIYHFAHLKGGECRTFYENETECHMKGKLLFFRWLTRQKANAVLEYYDRDIQQRPDILFHYQNKKYALEYQCSAISEQIFRQRTEAYIAAGYIPLWIIGEKKDGNHPGQFSGLTNFNYLFLRTAENGRFYLPSFSPDNSTLQLLSSIFPYSSKKALFQKTSISLEKLTLSHLLNPDLKPNLRIDYWKNTMERTKLYWLMQPNPQQKKFLFELYHHHLNLALLPPEIGLPVPHGLMIKTPPFVWQTYYYLDLLENKLPGDFMNIREIKRCLTGRIKRGEIMTRNLPLSKKQDPLFAYADYTCLLTRLGVLTRNTDELFQIKKQLNIPLTNREMEERTAAFYKENSKFFS